MKTKITAIFCSLILLTGCGAFEKPDKPAAVVSYIGDFSDPNLNKGIKPAEILPFLKIDDNHLHDGVIFRSRIIADAEREVVQYGVSPVTWLDADDNDRIAQLKFFREQVTKEIQRMEAEKVTAKAYSLVYENICKELAILSSIGDNATEKTVIIQSDLMEHEKFVSFYQPATLLLAQTNPQVIVDRLRKIAPMPRADSVQIYIVSRPLDYSQQLRFDAAANVFKLLLTQAGAKVTITQNIVHYGQD